jgi:hypothetical protein
VYLGLRGTGAVDDRGRFLIDVHPFGAAEHLQGHVFKLVLEPFASGRVVRRRDNQNRD